MNWLNPPVRCRLLDAVGQLRLLALAPGQHNVGEEVQQLAGRRRRCVGGLCGARLGELRRRVTAELIGLLG